METDQFPRFKAIMTGMSEVFQRELSNPLLDAYWLALRSWPLADFEAACGQLMQTATFMPRPVDFANLRKAGRPTAGEAWAAVLKYVRTSYSPNGLNYLNGSSGMLSDPLVDRAVNAIGGYRAIAASSTDSTHFLERRFCEHFGAIQESEEIREAVPQIAYSRAPQLQGPQRAGNLLGRFAESAEDA